MIKELDIRMMVRHGLGMYKLQKPGKQFISMIMLFRRILVTMQTIWTLRMVKNIGFPD